MMKFKVRRTSTSFLDDEAPCGGAKREKEDRIEVRTLGSFEEFDKKFGAKEGAWLSKGVDHRINEQGYVQRRIPSGDDIWTIEIEDMAALLAFSEQHGDLVLSSGWAGLLPEIEIYDGYRE